MDWEAVAHGGDKSMEDILSESKVISPQISSNDTSQRSETEGIDLSFNAIHEILPISYRHGRSQQLRIPLQDVDDFLKQDLDLDRLNKISGWLWMAGRPMPPRALHYQKFLQRDIIPVLKLDMHLVWKDNRIFIKPIPRYLMDLNFWKRYLRCQDGCGCQKLTDPNPRVHPILCKEQKLRRVATGFLYSYAGLIANEIDFQIAQENSLISKEITWTAMQTLLQGILQKEFLFTQIDRRFDFGELRLGRLNIIYRFTGVALLGGYYGYYSSYKAFWVDNLSWLASLTVYLALVLTAMQVGLATPMLSQNDSFQSVAYGFTIFAIMGPLAALASIGIIFAFVFVVNWLKTRSFLKSRFHKLSSKNR